MEFEKEIRIDIDRIPISVNSAYKRSGNINGRRGMYMSKPAKDFKEHLQWVAKLKAKQNKWKIFNEERFFYVDLYYTFKSRKRFVDPNNTHKITLDALEGILFENDRWALVRDMYAEFGPEEHLIIVVRIPKK
jgi:crossover junction endodeoxyribonuclease RusA